MSKFIGLTLASLAVLLASCRNRTEGDGDKDEYDELVEINLTIKEDPGNASLYYKRALFQVGKGFYESALKDLERCTRLDSTRADYFYSTGEVSFLVNRTRKARDAFEKCVQLDPKNVNALLKLGELYLYVDGHVRSIEYLDRALMMDKFNARAYMMKGLNFKKMGDTAKAVSSFQTAVEQNPDHYDAWMQLGLLHAARKNPLAADYYANAINLDPVSMEAHYGLAMFHQESGDVNKALESYNNILSINPGHAPTLYNLGYIYSEKFGKPQLALDFFRGALKADSSYVKAWYMRGRCSELLGDKESAASDYRRALTLDPGFSLALEGIKRIGF